SRRSPDLKLLIVLAERKPPTTPIFTYTTLFRSHPPGRPGRRDPALTDGVVLLITASSSLHQFTTGRSAPHCRGTTCGDRRRQIRSEEHTSELQSREKLVCRLLLEKINEIGREHI